MDHKVSRDVYVQAEQEVAWRFQCAPALIGIRAQNYDAEHFGGLVDPHEGATNQQRLKAIADARTVDETLARLPAVTRKYLELAYGEAPAAAGLAPKLRLSMVWRRTNLAPLAVLTDAAASGYEVERCRADRKKRLPGLVEWLDDEAGGVAGRQPNVRLLTKIRNEASKTVLECLAEYDVIRRERGNLASVQRSRAEQGNRRERARRSSDVDDLRALVRGDDEAVRRAS